MGDRRRESGPRTRPVDPRWVVDLREQCQRARVPFFFKQWGGRSRTRAGRLLEGRTWDEMPDRSGRTAAGLEPGKSASA